MLTSINKQQFGLLCALVPFAECVDDDSKSSEKTTDPTVPVYQTALVSLERVASRHSVDTRSNGIDIDERSRVNR